MRDDQAGLAIAPQEVLEENLRPQVEEVGRFVEEEQVGLVEQQGRELHPRLPTARERRHRPGEHRPLDLKLPRDLAALPVGLAAVPHQKVEGRLSGKERIVLPEVAEPEPGMADDFPGIEFFVPENHPQQGALAGPVAADETHPAVVGDRGRGSVEQNLVAVAF